MPLIRRDPDPPQAARGAHDPLAAPLAALTRGTRAERWEAARAAAANPHAAAALGQALAAETDARVRSAILTSLARIGTAESAAAVLPCLRSDDASLRTAALDALRAMPAAAAAHLPGLLADADKDVRLLACDLARGLPAEAATRLLCGLLGTEPEANVCAAAVDVLAEIGVPEALPALEGCAARFPADPFLGFAIRAAAARIGAERSGARG